MLELAENVKEVSHISVCYLVIFSPSIFFLFLTRCGVIFQLINPEIELKMVENTPDDPRQRKPNITKAKEILDWEPKVTLREGLPLMEEDFRQRLAIPKKGATN